MAIAAKRTKTIMARRQDLIQGTIRSIEAVGYNNSTVQSICDAAGLSRGLIGHYFKGKDDLLLEAFRYLVGQADENARQAIRAIGNDPLQRLLAVTKAHYNRTGKDDGGGMVWLACCGVAPWVPEMQSLQSKLWRRYRLWIERMMVQAADERGLRIDARRAAIMYAQMVDGLWTGWQLDHDAYSLDEASNIVCDWLLELFHERPSSRKLSEKIGAGKIESGKGKTSSKAPAPKTARPVKASSKASARKKPGRNS